MAIDRGYVAENSAQRARLRALVGRLSDAELGRPMEAGWTVASVLAHLAFWDQRIAVVVGRWRQAGPSAVPPAVDPGAVDWINDATKPMMLALPPRRAAEIAVAAADAADRALETLPDEFLAANQAAGAPVILVRARHRREHLDEIDKALAR
jgi:hypothetical protein